MTIPLPSILLSRELFSTRQAVAAGLQPEQLASALRQRQLTRVKRGWYTAQRDLFPVQRHRLLVQAQLTDHPRTVASHYSAAALLELPLHVVDWNTVHLMRLGSPRSATRKGLSLHGLLADEHAALTVSPALACVQTALLDPVSGLMATDHALHHKTVTSKQIDDSLTLVRRHRGYRMAVATLALADARRESPKESQLAFVVHVLGYLVDAQPVVHTRGGVFRSDFRIRGTRVLVEYDGEGKYTGSRAVREEKQREDLLREHGYEPVRVTKALLADKVALDARIRQALDLSRARQAAEEIVRRRQAQAQ